MEKKRLSLFYFLTDTLSDYKMLVFLVIVFRDIKHNKWEYILLISILSLYMILKFFNYRNTFYEVTDETIIYKKGIFTKTEKYINFSNIQNVDTTQNFLYQILNVVSLDINIMSETVQLRPISRKDANLLLTIINKKEINREVDYINSEEEVVSEEQDIYLKLGTKDLMLLAILKSRIIITLFAILAFYDDVADLIKVITGIELKYYIDNYRESVIASINSIIFFILLFLVFLFVISFVSTIVKFQNFTLENKADKLILRYGLFSKKSLVIKKDRIQKVSIEEPLRYRFLNLATVRIDTLSNNVVEDMSNGLNGIDLIPISKKVFAETFIREILKIDIEKYERENYETMPQKAKSIMLRWAIFYSVLFLSIFIPIIYFVPFFESKRAEFSYGLIIFAIIALIFKVNTTIFKFKNTSLALGENMIVSNYTSSFVKGKSYLKPVKVGSIAIYSNIFLKKHNLCHISVRSLGGILSGGIHINYFDKNYVKIVEDYLLEKGVEIYE